MNPRIPLLLLLTAALAGGAGWYAARQLGPVAASSPPPAPGGERRILYYQSAMHPWIRSDHPGKCTICGMELTPVFEGQAGLAVEPGLVSLSSNSLSVLNVQTVEVRPGRLLRTLRVAGTLEDDDSRHRILSAYVGGRIEELHVGFVGAEVEAGQPLARFYSPMLLEAERQFLAITRSPLGDPGHDSPTADTSGSLRSSAVQRLRQLGLTTAQIEALPTKAATNHFTEILSPVAGTVVSRFAYAGQYVMEGEKLFEIADLSTMWFRFDAYEQDLPWLQAGQTVEITTPSLPGRTFEAPIRFIEPSFVEMTRSTKVRVELPNPLVDDVDGRHRLLRHRIYAEGRVRTLTPEVLVAPRSAILSPSGSPVVYVDRTGGTYEQRRVTLGRVGDTECEILSGLASGERIVVSGNLLIDAQAQLNQVIANAAPGSHPATSALAAATSGTAVALPPLDDAQEHALTRLLTAADTVRVSLAANSLEGFRTALPALASASDAARQVVGTNSPWHPRVAAVTTLGQLPDAADLRGARRAFHPLSVALVDLGGSLRRVQPAFHDLRIYQCPMTAEAFDGAPARAPWFQLAPPLRNPWFGPEMLDCGAEIRP